MSPESRMDVVLEGRKHQVGSSGVSAEAIACCKASLAGSVSQRACVFCGSRVVIFPVADALHLVHGPIGCAVYTWDIRGALSSGPELHRLCFSTDLRERDVIFGGVEKLNRAMDELIDTYKPKAAFIYTTCIVGVIGDDVETACREMEKKKGIPVIPVKAPGFQGTKKDGYKIACEALFTLVGRKNVPTPKYTINILGDFNLAGELWILMDYYKRMGVHVNATITGDGRVDAIGNAQNAGLNVVQCSGSMMYLAKLIKEKYGTPFMKVSYFGIEDMSDALYEVAKFFKSDELMENARKLVREEVSKLLPDLAPYKAALTGKKAAIYVGGSFKAVSLVKALRLIGVKTVIVGSQTGDEDDYKLLQELCDEDTIIVDDSNPAELAAFVKEKGADLFIGGVKERPIAYKIGLGFVDHNHERKIPLAGYEGMMNFAKEVYCTVMSPVWKYVH